MDAMAKLYACLSINHNFHVFNPADGFVWQGIADRLWVDEQHIAALIKRIEAGELQIILDKARTQSPSLQHLNQILKSVKRLAILDGTALAIGYDKPPNATSAVIQEARKRAYVEMEIGDHVPFDPELLQRYGNDYSDAYIEAKVSGRKNLLDRFIK